MDDQLPNLAGLLENFAAGLRAGARKGLRPTPRVVRAVVVETRDASAFALEDVTDTPDPQQALELAAHLAAYAGS
jgi:hypothetical protein